MSIFTPTEMMYIQKKKENPLQWANDFLYDHIMYDVQKKKIQIVEALRANGRAVLFRFKDVEWHMSKKQEKEYMRNATRLERLLFRTRKEIKENEIEDNCYKHYVQSGYGAKASIRAILEHTDFISRLSVAFGDDFEVVRARRLADNSPRINFRDTTRPSFHVLDTTIEIEYKPKPKSAEQKATEFYKDYYVSTSDVMLVDKAVARHLVFEDDVD